jgi:hypothetical protein
VGKSLERLGHIDAKCLQANENVSLADEKKKFAQVEYKKSEANCENLYREYKKSNVITDC